MATPIFHLDPATTMVGHLDGLVSMVNVTDAVAGMLDNRGTRYTYSVQNFSTPV